MNFNQCVLQELVGTAATEISQWEYEPPYDVYGFKGHPNGYLLNTETWGKEQFYLACGNELVGYVSCQYDNDDLWVGWSLSPVYCGKGQGHEFISRCISEIRKVKTHSGAIYLRVAVWNRRAILAYQKAGFIYQQTIKDEIAYTNNVENFWIMVHNAK